MSEQSFFGNWGEITKDWVIGAFVSSTIDWIMSKVPVRNGIIGMLVSTFQLGISISLYSSLRGIFGEGAGRVDPMAYVIIWYMSPTAVRRLTSSYTRFHHILYGSTPMLKSTPTTSLSTQCKGGNCSGNINTEN